MKQRVLSLFIALLGIAAGAQADGLVIGGAKIEDGAWYNTSYGPKCLKAGTIKYDDPTHVTFENVTLNLSAFVGVVNCAVSSDINGLYITLVGENKILAEDISTGLYFSKSTSIKGDGSLSIVAAENAIEAVASAGLIITDAHVKAEGGKFGLKGVQSALTIKGSGILEVYGGTKCVGSFKSFREGTVVTAPEGATFKSSVLSVVDKDGNVIKNEWVTIQHAIEVNEETFPDENFRNWILAQDYGEDGYLTDTEIAAVTKMSASREHIANLKGIEFFTALKELWCEHNQLTALDLSKNTALKELNCFANHLTMLDVSNTALKYIECYINAISGENMDAFVKSLPDVTGTGGQLIVYSEEEFYNHEEMNAMTPAQVAAAKDKGWSVQKVVTADNGLPDLVDYEGEDVLTIDEENFPDANFRNWILAQDYGRDGYLTDTEIATVKSIDVSRKNIANLKGIEFFTALEKLWCYSNQLASLDLSQNTSLTALTCSGNQIKSLDVSKNTALEFLDCDYNQLTALDVSNNMALTYIDCYQNAIRGENMSAFVKSLPTVSDGFLYVYANETPTGNKITTVQVKIATDKHWRVKMYDGTDWVDYEGSDPGLPIDEENFPDPNFRNWILAQTYGADGYLDDDEIAAVTIISVYGKEIVNLQGIEFFTALTQLDCHWNQLTTLDVSKNTELTYLDCSINQLTALDLSQNTALTYLQCYNNQLTALDVSQNTELTHLYCYDNQLTALDVSKNTALTNLDCYDNQLTALDVSNTALIRIDCYLNAIRSKNMDAFVSSLPDVRETGGDLYVYADVSIEGYEEKNEMTSAQVAAASDKGWSVQKVVITVFGRDFADFKGVNVNGDLNDDDVVNIADVVILSNAIQAGSTDLMYDINGDNKVDANDINAIDDIITGE